MRTRALALSIIVAALPLAGPLASCASDRPVAAAESGAAAGHFAAAPAILSGFDIGPVGGHCRVGDRVLLGLRSAGPSGPVEKYLLITLMADWGIEGGDLTVTLEGRRRTAHVPSYIGSARVYDAQGRQTASTTIAIPAVCLVTGVYDYGVIAIESEGWDEARKAEVKADFALRERATVAFSSLIFQGRMLRDTRELNELLEGVIRRPGVLDAVFGGGFEISDGHPPGAGGAADLGGAHLPTVDVQMEFKYGWTTLGRLSGRVAPCAPPLGLAGGIIEAVADNPGRPGRVEAILLAARRGDGTEFTVPVPGFRPADR